jgi:hypothetical protein
MATAAVPAGAGLAVAQPTNQRDDQEIIVTAPALFRDTRPERDLDAAGIASYGVSTIDELIGEIQAEDGDDLEPVFLVNGQRVQGLDDIGAFPVEALRQVQVLPRGSATRVGGSPGQRVVSLNLQRQMRSATVTIAPRFATEGKGQSRRGEMIYTHIRGQTRANLALRVRDDDALLESDRRIVQPPPRLPYSTNGNVIAYPSLWGEIDPLLTDAAGTVVTVAPIPQGPNPDLAAFAAGANEPSVTDIGHFRTLRPQSRNYDLNGTFATRLTPWLGTTATIRAGRSESVSRVGLAAGLFILDPDNPVSPFSVPVGLAVYRSGQPLRYRSRRDSGEASLTLNATFGKWTATLNGRHSEVQDRSSAERPGSQIGAVLPEGFNPFSDNLGVRVATTRTRARSRTATDSAQLIVAGPVVRLPAGPLHANFEARLGSSSIRSTSSFIVSDQQRRLQRSEQAVRGGVEVPLASRRNDFLPALGELGATAEYSLVRVSDAGDLERHSLGLTWEPTPTMRLRAAVDSIREPAAIELLGNPVTVTPDARMFDVLTGETVDVVQTYGGNPSLLPQSTRTLRLSAIWRLVPRLGLQVNSEYTDSNVRDFVSSLPTTSAAVMLAFPDRFVRNADGVLTEIDVRPVNFTAHRQKRIRYGVTLNMPLGRRPAPSSPGDRVAPRTRLELTANHTIVLKDRILIRPGLAPVDLLDGGALGIGGGRLRNQIDGTVALSAGAMGVRVGASWRGGNSLKTRLNGSPALLHFSPQLVLNLRAFADANRLLPSSRWAQGLRLSANLLNLTANRQRVTDSFGNTPLQYQPAYRDPIGRTVEFEIRKVF